MSDFELGITNGPLRPALKASVKPQRVWFNTENGRVEAHLDACGAVWIGDNRNNPAEMVGEQENVVDVVGRPILLAVTPSASTMPQQRG